MNKLLLSLTMVGLLAACSPSTKQADTSEAPAAPSVKSEEVAYEADGITMKGYIAYDDNQTGQRPGILVVHEWWGLNDYARKRADSLAKMGYTALAIDMYGDGKTAGHPDEAGAFAQAVFANIEGATARFDKAMEVLQQHASTNPDQVAAIGYCFGGGVVLHMARFGKDLDAVVSFHGSLGTQMPADSGAVKAKVLACHGAADPFVSPESIDGFKAEMEAAGVDYKFVAYEGAVHSFTNPDADENGQKFELPLAYDKEADEQSWAEMTALFEEVFAQ